MPESMNVLIEEANKEKKPGFFDRLKSGISKTKETLDEWEDKKIEREKKMALLKQEKLDRLLEESKKRALIAEQKSKIQRYRQQAFKTSGFGQGLMGLQTRFGQMGQQITPTGTRQTYQPNSWADMVIGQNPYVQKQQQSNLPMPKKRVKKVYQQGNRTVVVYENTNSQPKPRPQQPAYVSQQDAGLDWAERMAGLK